LLLASCDKPIETISPDNSEVVESVSPSPFESPSISIEPSQTAQPSPSIGPRPTYTFTLPPSPTPTPVPERPSAYTKSEYFTFEEATGTITGYNVEGGVYVNIPESINGVRVEKIGIYAFARIDLYGVIIPEGVVEIQKGAFYYCFLEEVEIPKSVKIIADKAFYVNDFTRIDLPDELEYLGAEAFSGNKLTQVVIPDSLSRLETHVFYSNNIETLEIPASISYIGDYAFAYNKLASLILNDGTSYIGEYAFAYNKLTSLILNDSICSIGEGAFTDNELLSVKLPASLSEISERLFSGNCLTTIDIPSSVTRIGSHAFYDNELTHIDIPYSAEYIGSAAFSDNKLVEVIIPDNVRIVEGYAFSNNTIVNVQLGKGMTIINSSVFSYNNIKTLYIPDNITRISDGAFANNRIESLRLGPNVGVIEAAAFYQNNLKSVIIPSDVSVISDNAFENNNITDITLYGDIEYISDTAFDEKEEISATCIKGTYAEYFFNKKGMRIIGLEEVILSDMIPYTREDIIHENISFNSEDNEVLLAEKWVWEYLTGKYGSSFILKSFSTNADSDIVDSFICPFSKVLIKRYDVIYDFIKENNVVTESKTMQLVIIRNSENINVLSGIDELAIDFSNKNELYNYLSIDNRFTYWKIPDKSVRFSLIGDIAVTDFYPEEKPKADDSSKYAFPGTDYVLVSEEYNIFLKNTKTGEMKRLESKYKYDLTGYKAHQVIDSERYVYFITFHTAGVYGMAIHNITDDVRTPIYYPEDSIYMFPMYTDNQMIIIGNGEDDASDRIAGFYKTYFYGDDIGKLVKVTDDILYYNRYIFNSDGRYILYEAIPDSYTDDYDSFAYIVSDDQQYYKRHMKVIDLITGEVVKEGMIYEEVSQNGSWLGSPVADFWSHLRRYNITFAFDEAGNAYIRYDNNNFVINIY
jgi:hypothetical protein